MLECWLDRLPAVSAVASVPAIAAVSTASTATAASASAATITAAASAATAALRLGTRFVHYQVPPAKVLPIQRIHCPVGLFIVIDFDEREPTRLAGKAVANQIHRRRIDPCLREKIV